MRQGAPLKAPAQHRERLLHGHALYTPQSRSPLYAKLSRIVPRKRTTSDRFASLFRARKSCSFFHLPKQDGAAVLAVHTSTNGCSCASNIPAGMLPCQKGALAARLERRGAPSCRYTSCRDDSCPICKYSNKPKCKAGEDFAEHQVVGRQLQAQCGADVSIELTGLHPDIPAPECMVEV